MKYVVNQPLSCENRVLLGLTQGAPNAEAINNLLDKNKNNVNEILADMKQRENGVIIVNLSADALSPWLATNYAQLMAQGILALKELGNAKEVLICLSDENTANELKLQNFEFSLCVVPNSLVLKEPLALFTAIKTGEVRVHPILKEFLSHGLDNRPCCVVDGETACRAICGQETKLIAVCDSKGETASVCEIEIGSAIGTLLETQKPALLGEGFGRFVSNTDLANTIANYTWLCDSIMPNNNEVCMAQSALNAMQIASSQSCHNCVLCREGSWHLENYFGSITQGKGKKEDLAMIEDIAPIIAEGCFCQFGKSMAQTALSALATSKAELEAHIIKKNCPAGKCTAFSNYAIRPDMCTGCGECMDVCEEDAIEGKKGFIHMIDTDLCEKCGKCMKACEENAIVCGEKVRVPKKLTRVGRFN